MRFSRSLGWVSIAVVAIACAAKHADDKNVESPSRPPATAQRELPRPADSAVPSDVSAPSEPASSESDAGAESQPDSGARRFVFIHGAGGGHDQAKIEREARRCDAGELAGCHALALELMSPAEPGASNNQRAVAAFAKACLAGYAPSCNGLGVMYADGLGVPRDEARAVKLQESSCQDGVSTACLHVAHAFEQARGVAKDPAKARAFYAKACKAGATEGCKKSGPAP